MAASAISVPAATITTAITASRALRCGCVRRALRSLRGDGFGLPPLSGLGLRPLRGEGLRPLRRGDLKYRDGRGGPDSDPGTSDQPVDQPGSPGGGSPLMVYSEPVRWAVSL